MAKINRARRASLDAVAMKMKEVTGLSILYSQALAARLGINITDLECLSFASLGPGVTAGALAEHTGLTTGAITTVIDRLERDGFVQRKRDDTDRRKVVVVATAIAKRRAGAAGAPMRKIVDDVLSPYDDEQIRFLGKVLGELCEAGRQVVGSTHRDM